MARSLAQANGLVFMNYLYFYGGTKPILVLIICISRENLESEAFLGPLNRKCVFRGGLVLDHRLWIKLTSLLENFIDICVDGFIIGNM